VGTSESSSTGTEPDAAVQGMTPDAAVSSPDAPSGAFQCRDKQPLTAVGDGHHHPGENCLNACHNHGFTLAGTMTTTATATTPFVGASITVKDANGVTFDMVTQANGNFYTRAVVTFPVTVTASACPSIHAMSGTVTAGGCNKTGCHSATGGAGHITLP
ncbi:MAG TPA: hypothetical protein VMZ53_20020, partial [Kofleriaceae bacterium]|nr:hypothetical protein [Kofleriaceae bacterium]